jgi:Methylamine utilisation protein MauE
MNYKVSSAGPKQRHCERSEAKKLRSMRSKTIIEIISSLLIFLFVYTAISKLLDYTAFKSVLSKSPLIGGFTAVVVLALPITEGLVSVLLFIPRTRLWGLYGSLILMTVFTLYLAFMILFTPSFPCPRDGLLKRFVNS